MAMEGKITRLTAWFNRQAERCFNHATQKDTLGESLVVGLAFAAFTTVTSALWLMAYPVVVFGIGATLKTLAFGSGAVDKGVQAVSARRLAR